jgi:hypothetical protein
MLKFSDEQLDVVAAHRVAVIAMETLTKDFPELLEMMEQEGALLTTDMFSEPALELLPSLKLYGMDTERCWVKFLLANLMVGPNFEQIDPRVVQYFQSKDVNRYQKEDVLDRYTAHRLSEVKGGQ